MHLRPTVIVLLGVLVAPGPAQDDPDQVIRVLYLEDVPRWEFRYLRPILQRMPGVEFTAILGDGENGAPFPKTRAEFFAYDVILLGDISLHGDDAGRQDWMLHLMNFLDQGRGVAFLCGSRAMPEAYRNTILEKLLPVRLVPRAEGDAAPAPVRGLTRLRPPAGNEPHPVTLLPGPEGPATWRRLGAVEEYQPVQGLAPDGEAVLVDPSRKEGGQPAIVAAAGRWTKGRTFFLGTDQTWRWRNHGPEHQAAFWRNAVEWLAGRW